MTFETYPEDYSPSRPFHVEIQTKEDGTRSVRLFKGQYYADAAYPDFNPEGEVHPWNLGIYGNLIETKGIVSFWTQEFLEYLVNSLNDKYEKEIKK